MEGAPPAAGQQNQSAAEAAQEKTKRLLSLARSKLEENQATLAAKDAQIAQLRAALEAEAQSRRNRNGLGQEEKVPRNLLRRVDVEDLIWILVEYEGGIEDDWISFRSEEDLKDWVQRIPGAPLTIPPRCLTGAESLRIVSNDTFPTNLQHHQYLNSLFLPLHKHSFSVLPYSLH